MPQRPGKPALPAHVQFTIIRHACCGPTPDR
jgi:hypothetical protein